MKKEYVLSIVYVNKKGAEKKKYVHYDEVEEIVYVNNSISLATTVMAEDDIKAYEVFDEIGCFNAIKEEENGFMDTKTTKVIDRSKITRVYLEEIHTDVINIMNPNA